MVLSFALDNLYISILSAEVSLSSEHSSLVQEDGDLVRIISGHTGPSVSFQRTYQPFLVEPLNSDNLLYKSNRIDVESFDSGSGSRRDLQFDLPDCACGSADSRRDLNDDLEQRSTFF